MRPKMRRCVVEAAAQMLQKRNGLREVTIKGTRLIKDRIITRFTQVGTGAGNQPQRVIVEAAADIGIAFLG